MTQTFRRLRPCVIRADPGAARVCSRRARPRWHGIRWTSACVRFAATLAPALFLIGSADQIRAEPAIAPRDFDRARAAAVRAAVRRVEPSVVTIETIGGARPPPESKRRGGPAVLPIGPTDFRAADGPTTGLVWSADGWIISSAFNFARNPTIITVVLPGREGGPPKRLAAQLAGRDLIRQIVLLRVPAGDLPAPTWAEDAARPGEYAIACGRGLGAWPAPPRVEAAAESLAPDLAGFPAVSVGIVSAVGRRAGNAIQTDAKTSPSNYGGPLIDIDGKVLGLIVPLAGGGDDLAGVQWYDSGIGFAVTRAAIQRVVARLQAGDSIEPGKLGVGIDDRKDGRCRVAAVASPSPAEDAGLRPGDVIVELDGQPAGDRQEFMRRLSYRAAGETVRLGVLSEGQASPRPIELKLARPADVGEIKPPEEPAPAASQPAEVEPDE